MRKKLPLLLFSLPALLPLLLFVLYPFLEVVRFSTWDWSGLSEPRPVGLKNYQTLFQDPAFWKSLLVTLGFMLLALPPFLALSLVLAVVLDGLPYERLAKSLLFLPGLVTLGGATLSWYTLFTPEYGALAQFLPIPLGPGGVLGPPHGRPLHPVAPPGLRGPGGLGQAQGHPQDPPGGRLRGRGRAFGGLPLRGPAPDAARGGLPPGGGDDPLPAVLRRRLPPHPGGPYGATRVLGYYLYEAGFENFRLGYAAAITVVLLVLTLLFAYAQLRLLRHGDGEA